VQFVKIKKNELNQNNATIWKILATSSVTVPVSAIHVTESRHVQKINLLLDADKFCRFNSPSIIVVHN